MNDILVKKRNSSGKKGKKKWATKLNTEGLVKDIENQND